MYVLPNCQYCGSSEVGADGERIVCCGCGARWSTDRVQAAFGAVRCPAASALA